MQEFIPKWQRELAISSSRKQARRSVVTAERSCTCSGI